MFLLEIYFALSAFTFAVYAIDKHAAMHNQWRVAEKHLHLLSLAGGWPGAWIAQSVLRHKNRKREFQQTYLITIVANCMLVLAGYAFFGG